MLIIGSFHRTSFEFSDFQKLNDKNTVWLYRKNVKTFSKKHELYPEGWRCIKSIKSCHGEVCILSVSALRTFSNWAMKAAFGVMYITKKDAVYTKYWRDFRILFSTLFPDYIRRCWYRNVFWSFLFCPHWIIFYSDTNFTSYFEVFMQILTVFRSNDMMLQKYFKLKIFQ